MAPLLPPGIRCVHYEHTIVHSCVVDASSVVTWGRRVHIDSETVGDSVPVRAGRGVRVGLLGGMAAAQTAFLASLTRSELSIVSVPVITDGTPVPGLSRMDVLVTPILNPTMISNATSLRLVHSTGAGVDRISTTALPAHVLLCNCHGHATAMGEYALAAMLTLERGLLAADRALRSGDWRHGATYSAPLGGELNGAHLGIVGAGEASQGLVSIAGAVGMSVTVATRRPNLPRQLRPDTRVIGLDALDAVLGQLDYLVVAVPLTAATAGLVGARQLDLMKDTSVLVNMARAEVVDQVALYSALVHGTIRAAAIDVWHDEPRGLGLTRVPSQLDFHELDNVLITPHLAGWTRESRLRRWTTIADNIDRLVEGRPLTNLIDR